MRYHEGFKKKMGRALFFVAIVVTLAIGLGSVANMAMLVVEAQQEISK